MQNAARLLIGLMLLLITGCGGSDNTATNNTSPNGPLVSTPRQFGSLQFTVSTNKSLYTRGEIVPLTFTYKNIGSQPVTLATLCTGIDFKVFQGAMLIYHWNGGLSGCGGIITQTLNPGESHTFQTAWTQVSSTASSVPSGSYTIQVWLATTARSQPGVQPIPDVSQGNPETNTAANLIQITIQ